MTPYEHGRRPAVADDIVTRLRQMQHEAESKWPDPSDPPLTVAGEAADEIQRLRESSNRWQATAAGLSEDIGNAEDEIERLREELNTTQELLARCYTLAVGHGPNFDVFDDWEEAVSAYERETHRG